MKPELLLGLVALTCSAAMSETVYSIDLNKPPAPLLHGHLDLGGTGPGGRIDVNSHFIEKDGKPFIPVVGEFHYCRYPAQYWEESLHKMRAGGINVVATYVFWNAHERRQGQFDWSGNLNLRGFVEAAGRAGLLCIVRIGPFAHGEMRNGGLPDWLYGQPFEVRSNDAGYLALVEKLYGAIGAQLKGLMYGDGGPVIGVQLENEYQHSAAPWEIRYFGSPIERTIADRDTSVTHAQVAVSEVENKNAGYGRDHMVNLKTIARRAGLVAPLYTATGWGNAAIVPKGSIPVTAAYAFPFWAKPKPSPFYLFKDLKASPDYSPVSFDTALYPSIPAELGAGISITYPRRPYVPDESLEPLIVRVLGSGSNGIGYYMYHGGSTPVFDTFMNEDAGHGLPKINYDYQAPLGQYGQAKPSFHRLKLLHLFLASYGERVARTAALFPEGNAAIVPENTSTLRWAARAADGAGFLFLLNYQDHVELQDINDVRLEVQAGEGTVSVPSRGTLLLSKGASAILPINLPIGSAQLRSATVQPLTRFGAGGTEYHVFFAVPGFPPELVFSRGAATEAVGCAVQQDHAGSVIVTGPADLPFSFKIDGSPVLVVPRSLALNAVAPIGERLWFVDGVAMLGKKDVTVLSMGKPAVDVLTYPALDLHLEDAHARLERAEPPLPGMSAHRLRFEPVDVSAQLRQVAPRRHVLILDQTIGSLNDLLVTVDYVGDTGMAFVDGSLVNDHFYNGRPWEISLRQLLPRLQRSEMVFLFQPMRVDAPYLQDLPVDVRPRFETGQKAFLEVNGVRLTPEYKARLQWR